MSKKLTTEQFVDKAKQIHGDKYDYSITKYKSRHEKISFICTFHGIVTQDAGAHLQGHGCPKCSWGRNKGKISDNKTFIEKARRIHGDKYLYDRVIYAGYYTKVEIVCPKHGSFFQSPEMHNQGYGCPKCGYERTHYFNRDNKDSFTKKGKSKIW